MARDKVYELHLNDTMMGSMAGAVLKVDRVRCEGFYINVDDSCVHFWTAEEDEHQKDRVDELVVPLSNLRYFKRVRD